MTTKQKIAATKAEWRKGHEAQVAGVGPREDKATTKQKIAATKADRSTGREVQVMGVGPHDKLREECGVFGIFGHPEAANLTYLGLYALQHRGQESGGIAASDGARIRVSKGMGHVNDVFDGGALGYVHG